VANRHKRCDEGRLRVKTVSEVAIKQWLTVIKDAMRVDSALKTFSEVAIKQWLTVIKDAMRVDSALKTFSEVAIKQWSPS
jgi:hypothetical protein